MSLFSTIGFIWRHPLARRHRFRAMGAFFKYQLATRLSGMQVVYPLTDRVRILAGRGMTGVTGNIYTGLHEFEDMGFLLHFLRSDDIFVDVGANVGVYTMLAAGHVGCKTYALEPVPEAYNRLMANIGLNRLDNVQAFQVAAGPSNGLVRITVGKDTMNHLLDEGVDEPSIMVPQLPLDEVLQGVSPNLIKIDVEGFELSVIVGAKEVLKLGSLDALIIERKGPGDWENQFTIIRKTLEDYGFASFVYDPFSRTLMNGENTDGANQIFIRNLSRVRLKLDQAVPFLIYDELI